MAEYIKREAVLEWFRPYTHEDILLEPVDVISEIRGIPAADAVEVVHGRWIPIIDEPTPLRKMPMLSGYRCSVCGRYEEKEEPYCNCGAKMDGGQNENT